MSDRDAVLDQHAQMIGIEIGDADCAISPSSLQAPRVR